MIRPHVQNADSDATVDAGATNTINTEKWYRKGTDLWAELGDEIPFG
jgi:hypothetical protein